MDIEFELLKTLIFSLSFLFSLFYYRILNMPESVIILKKENQALKAEIDALSKTVITDIHYIIIK